MTGSRKLYHTLVAVVYAVLFFASFIYDVSDAITGIAFVGLTLFGIVGFLGAKKDNRFQVITGIVSSVLFFITYSLAVNNIPEAIRSIKGSAFLGFAVIFAVVSVAFYFGLRVMVFPQFFKKYDNEAISKLYVDTDLINHRYVSDIESVDKSVKAADITA